MRDRKAKPPGDERDNDIFVVRVRATEAQVNELLRRGGFDYGDREGCIYSDHISEQHGWLWSEGSNRPGIQSPLPK
jgi:hypothetical protein